MSTAAPADGATVRHIVMWNVQGATPEEHARNIALLREQFLSLRGRIPGLLRLELGVDTSRVDYACDVVLYSEFASQAALDAYATHPEHLRVRAALGGLRTARHQVDYAAEPDLPERGPFPHRQPEELS